VVGTGTLQEPHPSLNLAFGVVGSVERLLIVAGPLVGLGVLLNVVAPATELWLLLITPGPLTGSAVGGTIDGAVFGVMAFSALPGTVERVGYRASVSPES
jgi:hypothetical protein